MRLTPDPLDLPGPRRFFRRVLADLDQLASLVVACPDAATAHTVSGIVRANRRDVGRDVTFIELEDVGQMPARDVVTLFGHEPPAGEIVGVPDLVAHDALRGRVLWVDTTRGPDIDEAPDDLLDRWFAFLQRFDEAAKGRRPDERPTIVTLLAGDACHRRSSGAATIWWWNVIRRLDTATYVEEMFGDAVDPSTARCAVEIAKFDIELVEVLLAVHDDGWFSDDTRLRTLLVQYATDRHLVSEQEVVAGEYGDRTPDQPPGPLVAQWAAGTIEWWDGAIDVHSAVRAIADPSRAARRLLWRGQLGSLLPTLEAQRERLAAWAADRQPVIDVHGLRSHLYEEYRYVPLDELEFAQLAVLIGAMVPLRAAPEELRRYVGFLREARNCLAHFSPVPRFRLRQLEEYRRKERALLGR